VYLPSGFVGSRSFMERRGILAHELAHVSQWDAAVNVLQILVQAAFFFHPLLWWANRKIRQEREKCCDEIALACLGRDPAQYSKAIAESLVLKSGSRGLTGSLAVAGGPKALEERIKTIMTYGKRFRRRPAWSVKIAALVLACVVLLVRPLLVARQTDVDARSQGVSHAAVSDPRGFLGTWVGDMGGPQDGADSRESLRVTLHAEGNASLAGSAEGFFLPPGGAALERIRFRENRIEFEVRHRAGLIMRITLERDGNTLAGRAMPVLVDGDPCRVVLARRGPVTSQPAAGGVEIEAMIDGNTELWVTRHGIQWKHLGGAAKVGRHVGHDEPTWVNGKPWKPSWGKPDGHRAADRTHIYPLDIGPIHDLRLELVAIGLQRGAEGIERRSPITTHHARTVKTSPDPGPNGNAMGQVVAQAVVFTFPDPEGGHRWYRFRLTRGPAGATSRPASRKSRTARIVPSSADVLDLFASKYPPAWRVEDGQLIGEGIGPQERPLLTCKTWFDSISRVEIRGSVDPAPGPYRRPIPRDLSAPVSTNFRVGVGPINLIFNWELADRNHYRNGSEILITRGHALTPGTEHTIVIEQRGSEVTVSVAGKVVYTAETRLYGTVTVYPAHGSRIRVSQITIDGVPDPTRQETGHSHGNTW